MTDRSPIILNVEQTQYQNLAPGDNLVFPPNSNIELTGNVLSGNVLSNGYFYANGQPLFSSGAVIADEQFDGNGNAVYYLTRSSSTIAAIVNLNGVTQAPTISYTIAGNTLTFSNTISSSDHVDIRYLGDASGTGVSYTGVYTAATLRTIIGKAGAYVAVSNSFPGGQLAYWNTSASIWCYVNNNSPV